MSIKNIDKLIASARNHTMSAAEREEQRQSFARGNVAIDTGGTRRSMVNLVAPTVMAVADAALIGKVGVCSKGVAGFITGSAHLPWGLSWVGFRQSDGRDWASRLPKIIDERPSASARAGHARATADWKVVQEGDSYYLSWPLGCMQICSAELPVNMAIDAAMEFMDRFREHDAPRWVEDPGDLMRFCVSEAKNQR